MSRLQTIEHRFVDSIPDQVDSGTLYVCIEYATAIHACCCGCGREVVTPFTPTDWLLSYDGETVSLSPSVGNWSFDCQSHYIIERGRVRWAGSWSREQIESGRIADRHRKRAKYDAPLGDVVGQPATSGTGADDFVGRLRRWTGKVLAWLRWT